MYINKFNELKLHIKTYRMIHYTPFLFKKYFFNSKKYLLFIISNLCIFTILT